MVVTRHIRLKTDPNATKHGMCIIDITPQVRQEVADSGLRSGTATLFIAGSTAGISTIEFESGVMADLQDMWDRVVPRGIAYQHDRRWGDGNGYSHVRASLQGASLVIPFTDKILALGTWQQIVFLDFDNRPRQREIVVQIIGD